MRSALLYFLGVPIPIIILIAMFTHHCWRNAGRLCRAVIPSANDGVVQRPACPSYATFRNL